MKLFSADSLNGPLQLVLHCHLLLPLARSPASAAADLKTSPAQPSSTRSLTAAGHVVSTAPLRHRGIETADRLEFAKLEIRKTILSRFER